MNAEIQRFPMVRIWQPPEGEKILAMTKWRDYLVVATSGGVYVKRDEISEFEKLNFIMGQDAVEVTTE